MNFSEIASFEVFHEKLSWPWVTFDASGRRFVFAAAHDRIGSRVVEGDGIAEGPSFALPQGMALGDLHGFSIASSGERLAVVGIIDGASCLAVLGTQGESRCTSLESLAGPGFTARAIAFDRTGQRVWIAADSATETALALVDVTSHERVGISRTPPFPPPAMHEIYLHPQDDAVLLLAACGEDGTFAWSSA